MSHFSQIATKIFNKELLLESLRNLGYEVEENAAIRGYRGQETQVDIAVRMQRGYDVGFTLSADGTYNFVADWFGVEGTNEQEFVAKVQQQYALVTVMDQVNRQGFNVVEQQRDANGAIRIVARRWV